jgi:putative LysE/RhtB family amino acid efflux pump
LAVDFATVLTALVTGLGFGLLVAAQIGPISLLLIRSVVRGGDASVGIAIGAGAAVVDTGYAALGIAGAGPVLAQSGLRPALGVAGAAVIAALGLRTLWSAFRVRVGGELEAEVRSPRRAFLTSLAATASNPTTIGSWAAIFAAASAAGVARSAGEAGAMLVGVGIGSLAWFVALSCGVALARRRVGPRLIRAADAVAGAGLVGFAGVLAYRAGGDA